ncbi:uncharacterized protein CTRU02_201070 [Colletotrichum truncatum]|uniref:Uncharacterized protein n=1 Tax=Colletotrichum truncatum TaxID=5467 RepID=A0ACC3ZG96_COLTU|nr:uncharacterized protein CTRU02_12383 [Colletotrichum truncatum]KAF6784678.1 hypothetical protein CTRU02_12383 [Colletotrichum truncatum]
MSKTNFTDNADTYAAALLSLFRGKLEDTESDLEKLFTPDFTIRDTRNDGLGKVRDYAAWVEHVKMLRTLDLGIVDFKIVQFLRDGSQLAERHTAQGKGPEGKVVRTETLQFAEIAEDGRIKFIVETVSVFE